MLGVDYILLVSGVLLLLGVLSSKFSARVGLPVLVLFVLVGMLAGEDGIGRIEFDNYRLAYGIGTVALCVILFDGGLRTPRRAVQRAWRPAGLLATAGVLVTSVATGVAAAWILGLSLLEGVLLGSIVGSTDAAAVFSILRSKGLRLKERLASTLEVESGSNDPMAIFLTVGLLEVLTGGMGFGLGLLWLFVLQMGAGFLVGAAVGWLAVRLVNRIQLDAAGLYPVLTGVCGLLAFGIAAVVGGSGFLAVYVAGICVGNSRLVFQRGTLQFHDGLAWIGQIAMFVVLGLLSTPSELVRVAGPALLIAAVLIFVARPLAVFPMLLPFGYRPREMLFVSWVGLKGAVPVILAIYPLLYGLPDGAFLFNVVFFVVLVSAVTQGWSLPAVARLLGLQQPQPHSPPMSLDITSLREVDAEIVGYSLDEGSRAVGLRVNQLGLPDGIVVAIVSRGEELIPPKGSTAFKAGDYAFVVARPSVRAIADRVFGGGGEIPRWVEFPFPGATKLRQLRRSYGIHVEGNGDATLGGILEEALGRALRNGDHRSLPGADLHVREVVDGKALTVGLVLQEDGETEAGGDAEGAETGSGGAGSAAP